MPEHCERWEDLIWEVFDNGPWELEAMRMDDLMYEEEVLLEDNSESILYKP